MFYILSKAPVEAVLADSTGNCYLLTLEASLEGEVFLNKLFLLYLCKHSAFGFILCLVFAPGKFGVPVGNSGKVYRRKVPVGLDPLGTFLPQ